MKSKQIEVYNHYKRLYPETIVLFHIGNNYVALFQDAAKVAKSLFNNPAWTTDKFEFPCNDIRSISKLGDSFQVHMVDYRNDNGVFDFPDIHRLEKEKNEDY